VLEVEAKIRQMKNAILIIYFSFVRYLKVL